MANRAEWTRRVRRWRASGLTGGEFATAEGLIEGTLRHWAWRLGRDGVSESVGPECAFVEVALPAGEATVLEVVLRRGVTIRVPTGFDEETLRRAVATLERT
jgi:hypothetical protein